MFSLVAAARTVIPGEPCWSAIKRQFNPHNYLLSGRWPWALTITAKPWADLTDTSTQASVGFHDPVTWVILGDLHKAEKADATSPTDRTWYEWDRATITDKHIVFTAPVAGRGNQLNRATRPVILPGHGRYKVSCSFSGNTGTAKLIARGYTEGGRDHGRQHGCVGNTDHDIHHRAAQRQKLSQPPESRRGSGVHGGGGLLGPDHRAGVIRSLGSVASGRVATRETVVHGARSRRDLSGPDVAAIFCRDQPT